MGTFELLIVFAALMAVISLVAIAIDWVGRPLKNRRFIPRIYRYEDEVSPLDVAPLPSPLVAAGPPLSAAPPVSVTPPVLAAPASMAPAVSMPPLAPPPASMAPASPPIVKPSTTTVAASLAPRPPSATGPVAPATTTSAFQDNVGLNSDAGDAGEITGDTGDTGDSARPRGIAETVRSQSATAWTPDMPLDARVDDANPTPDEKAQRYWMATAHGVGATTHFDDVNLARMALGKAPTRRNPRTGDVEAMELVGLRASSHRSDVRMKWPDETVDPWSSS